MVQVDPCCYNKSSRSTILPKKTPCISIRPEFFRLNYYRKFQEFAEVSFHNDLPLFRQCCREIPRKLKKIFKINQSSYHVCSFSILFFRSFFLFFQLTAMINSRHFDYEDRCPWLISKHALMHSQACNCNPRFLRSIRSLPHFRSHHPSFLDSHSPRYTKHLV